jgi:hypothetical protein
MKWTNAVSSQNKITINARLNYFRRWIQYYRRDKKTQPRVWPAATELS